MVIQEVDAQVPEELEQASRAGRHLAQLNKRAGSQAVWILHWLLQYIGCYILVITIHWLLHIGTTIMQGLLSYTDFHFLAGQSNPFAPITFQHLNQ